MTWLDVVTPIPETLIKDDERRKAVNRGILLVAIALVVVVKTIDNHNGESTDSVKTD